MIRFDTLKNKIFICYIILLALSLYYFADQIQNELRRYYLEATEETMVDELILLKKVIENHYKESQSLHLKSLETSLISPNVLPNIQIYSKSKTSQDLDMYITDQEGFIKYDSRPKSAIHEDYRSWRNVNLALAGLYGARSTRQDEEDPSSSIIHVSLPLYYHQQIIGTVTLTKPVISFYPYINHAKAQIVQTAGLIFLALICMGILIIAFITRPVEKLHQYVKGIRDGKPVQAPQLPRGEIKELSQTIEEMKEAIDGKQYVENYIQALTHELKSPIAGIQGAAELLQAQAMEPKYKKLLMNIDAETKRMDQLIQQLLLLARLESGEQRGDFIKQNLEVLLKSIVEICKDRYPKFHIAFNSELDDTEQVFDATLIELAVSNLLTNSSLYSKGKEISVHVYKQDEMLTIEVLDEGGHIPEYAIEKVTDKFFRCPNEENTRSSGMGLAIVKHIANLHGGSLTIANRGQDQGVLAKLCFQPKFLR